MASSQRQSLERSATHPSEQQPMILFLDGHGSHWNKDALKFPMDNCVFLYILASHTSISSQPNNADVNKHFHWATEHLCKKYQHTLDVSTIPYFNTNFANGWQQFLQEEKIDLWLMGLKMLWMYLFALASSPIIHSLRHGVIPSRQATNKISIPEPSMKPLQFQMILNYQQQVCKVAQRYCRQQTLSSWLCHSKTMCNAEPE